MAIRDRLEAKLGPAKARLDAASELQRRIVTGLALALLALTVILIGGYLFIGFVMLCAMVMLLEWNELTVTQPAAYRWGGLLYILVPSLCLIVVRHLVFPYPGEPLSALMVRQTPLPLLHLISMVIATDIGAYAVGRKFGRTKIAPSISPGKTWEGLVGGIIASLLVSALLSPATGFPDSRTGAILLGIIIACVAQAGDFFESSIKRRAGVKDSGRFLPGHGGLLDRFDGLLFAAPLYLLLARINGGWF